MKDKEAKIWLSELFGVSGDSGGHFSDLGFIVDNIHYCFEYENSSRGMASHLCKHYRLFRESPACEKKHLIFIRTLLHVKTHIGDYINSSFMASKISGENFKMTSYSEAEFLDPLNGFNIEYFKNRLITSNTSHS